MILFGLNFGLVFALIQSLLVGSTSALVFGGYEVLKHGFLRKILADKGSTPINYSNFLDYSADKCLLLRKVGGGYIFIHRYLLEYFASR
jgi:hypothetical protein